MLNTEYIYYYIICYKNYIEFCINIIKNMFCYYRLFILLKSNFIILTILKKLFINLNYFNYYG